MKPSSIREFSKTERYERSYLLAQEISHCWAKLHKGRNEHTRHQRVVTPSGCQAWLAAI